MPSGGRRPGAGRPRISPEEKLARGTLVPHREATYRAQDAARLAMDPCPVPPPPDDLDDSERRWWERLGAAVDQVGTFTAADEHVFRLLVENRALLAAAKSGAFVESGNDGSTKPVGVAGLVSLTKTCAGLMAHFGLTPTARGKVLAVRAVEEPAESAAKDPDDIRPLRVVP